MALSPTSVFDDASLFGGDPSALIVAVQDGAARNNLEDLSCQVKTKFFNSRKSSVATASSSTMSAKDLWLKYVQCPPWSLVQSLREASIQSIRQASGIQYTVTRATPLAYFIDNKDYPVSFDVWSKTAGSVGADVIASQRVESVQMVCAHCELSSGAMTAMAVFIGVKKVSSLFYHAVESNNSQVLQYLLELVDKQEAGGKVLNPIQRTSFFLLENSASITDEDLIGMGGPDFTGAQKFTTSFPIAPGLPAQEAPPPKTLARQNTFTTKLTTDTTLDAVPKWDADNCKWKADPKPAHDRVMSPLELAFEMRSWSAWNTLVGNKTVQDDETELNLRCTTSLDRDLPDNLARMRNLTSLRLCVDPLAPGPVPAAVFELLQLRSLTLRGSKYTSLPDAVSKLEHLEMLDVAGMPFKTLPVLQLGKLRKLTFVDCSEIALASPPAEVVQHGPGAVARYILDLGDGAAHNNDVLLMLIGDGEAGKTSTLRALKNTDTNCASTIDVDDRTVGIDISSFQPDITKPLRFFAWDFGGQGIYAVMQQLFVSRRALYPLLWRVRQSLDVSHFDSSVKCDVCHKRLVASPGEKQEPVYRVKGQGLCHASCVSYDPLISSWTERLQFRVPGVPMVLIATHIDCATPQEVDEQCAAVQEVAARLLARQQQTSAEIPPLRIHNNGHSLRVNNMNGEGVAELRKELCAIAESLDFYDEVIPASYMKLREKLRAMQVRDTSMWRTWLPWTEYAALGKACGLADVSALRVATRFFHDMGELRFFDEQKEAEDESRNDDNDGSDDESDASDAFEDVMQGRGGSDDEGVEEGNEDDDAEGGEKVAPAKHDTTTSVDMLNRTVFPNPFWVVDVLRGLIRHDLGPVLELTEQNEVTSARDKKTLRRRLYRLMQRGILHESLLPYIWHGVAGMSTDEATNKDEFGRLIALMKAFDILMDKPGESAGSEWIVPTLMAGKSAHTMEGSMEDGNLPFACRLVYDALPPYFDMILVAHIMNRRVADSVTLTKGAAAFKKLAERAQLFAGQGKVRDPLTVFRPDQVCTQVMKDVLRPDQCHVVIVASSRELMVNLLKQVSHLEKFFPGLRRLCTLFPCYTCRALRAQHQELTQGTNDATALLAAAEAENQALLVDLQPHLEADAARCTHLYLQNAIFIKESLLKYPELAELFCAEYATGAFVLEFKPCSLVGFYSKSGEELHTMRFYFEVMKFLTDLLATKLPTTDGEQLRLLAECQRAVDDRQFEIAFQQAGAELPTLRTIHKYCARHVNALFQAWELCPELEVLCMSLDRALQEEKQNTASDLSVLPAIENLQRADAAPEYMHLLRSVVEVMCAGVRPQTAHPKSHQDLLDTLQELLALRGDDLSLLNEYFPELESTASGPVSKIAFLEGAYGHGTTAYLEELLALYTALLGVFTPTEDAPAEALQHVEQFYVEHRALYNSTLPPHQILNDLLDSFIRPCCGYDSVGIVYRKIRDVTPLNDKFLHCGALQMHLFLHHVEQAMHDAFQAHLEELTRAIQAADSAFVWTKPCSMKLAALSYFKERAAYIFTAQGMLHHKANGDTNSTKWRAACKDLLVAAESKKVELSFASLLEDIRFAEKALFLALCVQQIDKHLRDNPLARELFEAQKAVGDESVMLTELVEYYATHVELIVAVLDMQHDDQDEIAKNRAYFCNVCCAEEEWIDKHFFCTDSDSKQYSPFPTAAASLQYLKRVVELVFDGIDGFEDYHAIASKMRAFELEVPLSDKNGAIVELNSVTEDIKVWQYGVRTLARNQAVGFAVLDTYEIIKDRSNQKRIWADEMVRFFSYLADDKDINALPELLTSRIEGLDALLKYVSAAVAYVTSASEALGEGAPLQAHERAMFKAGEAHTNLCDAVLKDSNPSNRVSDLSGAVATAMERSVNEVVHERAIILEHFIVALKWKSGKVFDGKVFIQAHLDASKARAQAHRDQRLQSVEQMRSEGTIEPALKAIVSQSKRGLKTYTDLVATQTKVSEQRVMNVTAVANARGEKYVSVQRARLQHGPAWYFGGACKRGKKKVELVEDLYRKHWKDDWEYVMESGRGAAEIKCPASFGVELHEVAQPKQPTDVLVSVSTEGEHFAATCLLQCSTFVDLVHLNWTDMPNRSYVGQFDPERASHVIDESGRFVPYAHDIVYDRVFAHHGTVRVWHDGVLKDGTIQPESVNDVHVQAFARGNDIDTDKIEVFHVSKVRRPESGSASEWLRKAGRWIGTAVKIEVSPGVSEEFRLIHVPIEVCAADGTSYGFYTPDQIVLVHDAKIMNAKAMIVCIDDACGSSLQCQHDLQRAHDLGMGIIPIILPGYDIIDYQRWWPSTMPSLQHHSLFIDMRNCHTGPEIFWANCIEPSINVMFNEYVPRKRSMFTIPAMKQAEVKQNQPLSEIVVASVPEASLGAQSGAQYVYCDLCAASDFKSHIGTRRSKNKNEAIVSSGAFDRWRCQQLVGEWTAQELRRREESPDEPAVFSCPTMVCCSGEVPHEKLVRDVLSVQEKKTSYACPSCVSKGILPPYCFDRDECLAELEDKKTVSIMCKRCLQFIPQHELLACEVFLSYCWGAPECPDCTETASVWELKRLRQGKCESCNQHWPGGNCRYTTQRLVTETKLAVQDEAGVMCWQDVDRLVGGKDLEREMEVGVQRADVVVIFLDDGYVRSANCRKEYLYSTKHGKYIIPVLLRGYTHSKGEMWWPESMASLAQFEPVLLQEEAHMEHALQTICERIQSRFHRAQRYATADDAIAYLRDYSSWGAARKAFLTEKLSLDKQVEIDAFVQRAFNAVDRDGDNSIDAAELAQFLDDNNLTLSPEQISTLMMEADVDNNGVLSLEELKMAIYAMIDERDRENAVD